MNLVANVNPRAAVHLPNSVKNMGVVPPQQHRDVMAKAKVSMYNIIYIYVYIIYYIYMVYYII